MDKENIKTIEILSGIPGAGKTHFFKQTYGPHNPACFVSADSYFTSPDGSYHFVPTQLGQAHAFSLLNYIEICRGERGYGLPHLVVDNTNTTIEEIAPYYAIGQAYGHNVRVKMFFIEPEVAVARQTHGVPEHVIEEMAKRLKTTYNNFPRRWDVQGWVWDVKAKEYKPKHF